MGTIITCKVNDSVHFRFYLFIYLDQIFKLTFFFHGQIIGQPFPGPPRFLSASSAHVKRHVGSLLVMVLCCFLHFLI